MLRYAAMMMIAGLLMVSVLPGTANAENDIEGLMKTIAGGKGGAHKVLKKLLATPETDWEKVSAETKKYAEATGKLGATKPEKGDSKSWEKLCKEFDAAAKELNAAATKKDKKAADTAYGKLSESCEVCHEAHR
ncbi:cytochrome c [Zavarzinella formosa]|uniref:cytochrome c n=1 Tax=Zavarzinella formosa TaxID=360055 RepID=UPI000312F746|nr:cytochrome c [Zavarzinella formosa]